ncbi:MAG: class I SAM-dependent methyltransferase [Deltaproteobacteria bacterium]|nr:class I SAM-dependent methyltransferase [Deltaproteobacteria bacterium]
MRPAILHRPKSEIANRVLQVDRSHLCAEKLALEPFGPLGAARYDVDASRMPRRYKCAHKIQNELVINALRKSSAPKPTVLDLGCGTANDGFQILSKTTSAIYFGLDYSSHMIKRAEDKLARHGLKKRSLFLERDFRFVDACGLWAGFKKANLARQVSVVISALALHHYELAEKLHVYTVAYDLLQKGGLFVLTDLFSNSISSVADLALLKESLDVRISIKRLIGSKVTVSSNNTTLSVSHYTDENHPHILSDEIELLLKRGFENVDVVYRHGQLGVICAAK